MDIKKLLEKMGLDEAAQTQLEEGITALIKEKVESREEELKKKYAKLSENYVAEEVEKQLVEEKKKLEEQYKNDLKLFESECTEALDKWLESEISEKINEKELHRIAVNETYGPVVEGIKKLFKENSLELDSEADTLVKDVRKENEQLKEEYNKVVEEKLELAKAAETGAIKLRVLKAVNGLNEDQAAIIWDRAKDKDFDIIDEEVDIWVESIVEKEKNDDRKELNESDDHTDEKDGLGDNHKSSKTDNPSTIMEQAEGLATYWWDE